MNGMADDCDHDLQTDNLEYWLTWGERDMDVLVLPNDIHFGNVAVSNNFSALPMMS